MAKKHKLLLLGIIFVVIGLLLLLVSNSSHLAILNPKGIIASKERNLILGALALSLTVIVPVFILTFFIATKYREGANAEYKPDWKHSKVFELAWWVVPAVVISILAIVAWKGAHELDPYKPLAAAEEPITIKVIALRWKWLFLYPGQNIATVNFVQFPSNTPISFDLTADAPMNSFWIPQLSGQIYAMAGMQTHLHLMADKPGEFAGSAAEINGQGFAGMKFTAKATSAAEFYTWIQSVKNSSNTLDTSAYNKLAEPSENNPIAYYSWVDQNLFDNVIMKYMAPANDMSFMEMR